jgi:hypothetical protein
MSNFVCSANGTHRYQICPILFALLMKFIGRPNRIKHDEIGHI